MNSYILSPHQQLSKHSSTQPTFKVGDYIEYYAPHAEVGGMSIIWQGEVTGIHPSDD
jgi:hypothetical protein